MLINTRVENLPQFQTVTYRKLHRNAVRLDAVIWLIIVSVAITALTIVYYFTDLIASENAVFVIITLTALMLILFSMSLYSYKFKGYALREFDIIYKSGIFWQKKIILPFNRIQHLESTRGPLERKFGLATLCLFSAGGLTADLTIFGLEEKHCNEIRQLLLDKIQKEQDYNND
ncbi:MAG: hypothetical protein COA74_11245 [Gammaproteobacteria bacterium]|nr:MAG: hypothetical protein COA74_11245 [Gammaproteobacteria bacterium]PHS67868.1 MAG: hypothetical protein COB00_08250 [Alcanivorax sp.]